LALVCGGCASDGLSPREDSTNNLSATVYPQQPAAESSVTVAGSKLTVAPAKPIDVPIRVGVVQTGDVAPPQSMLDGFRKHKELFGLVEPLPGNVPLATLRNTAAGMGLNYLLVYGGTVDRSTAPTQLELFNLTVIGLFIVPSDQITANGKAAGSLIDVSTGTDRDEPQCGCARVGVFADLCCRSLQRSPDRRCA
jgi:hypothetical protein